MLGSSRTATVTAILHTLIVCNLFAARKIKRHCTHSALSGVVSSPQLTFIAFWSRSKQVEEEIQIYIIIVLMEALHLYRQTTESSLALARHTKREKKTIKIDANQQTKTIISIEAKSRYKYTRIIVSNNKEITWNIHVYRVILIFFDVFFLFVFSVLNSKCCVWMKRKLEGNKKSQNQRPEWETTKRHKNHLDANDGEDKQKQRHQS